MSKQPDLTADQRDELKAAFTMFDKDGDGAISIQELSAVLQSLGQQCPTEDELQLLMNSVDTDQNGVIDFEEFVLLMNAMLTEPIDHEAEMLQVFRVFDKDGDGFISEGELRLAMMNLGERMSDAELREMIAAADTDGNGQIDYAEFVAMMQAK